MLDGILPDPNASHMPSLAHRGRTRPIRACDCGCGQNARWNRLVPIRTAVRAAYVLEECRGPFLREITAGQKLRALIASTRGMSFLRRWPHTADLYRLQVTLHARHHGTRAARRAALRTAALFCLPRRLGLWLSRNRR
jgi:hypothetical protein